MKRFLIVAVLVLGVLLSGNRGSEVGQTSPGLGDTDASRPPEERSVLEVEGIPREWKKSAVRRGPTHSPGVTVEAKLLTGTEGDDEIVAGEGYQAVRGLGGRDALSGGRGEDRIHGGPGGDFINAQDLGPDRAAGRDEIDCGPGLDQVLMDGEGGERPRRCELIGVGFE